MTEAIIPFSAASHWLFQEALPFWAEHGVDRQHGGFLEELGAHGEAGPTRIKRVRAQARQIYVFSHAQILGWPQGEKLAALGVEYLARRAQTPDGGWARLLSREGQIVDASADLYDISFVLHGLAWRVRANGDDFARALLHQTMRFVETQLTADRGYWHCLPPTGPRLQNPHMHLMEACLACFDAIEDEHFLHVAGALAELFHDSFFNGETLGEEFNVDWSRRPSQTIEPGHQFEWAWLLGAFAARNHDRAPRAMLALVEFGERFGVDASGAVYDAVRETGQPLRASSRTWPNTERLKAHLAIFEHHGVLNGEAIAQSANLLLDRYLATRPRGAWIDQFDEHGAPMATIVPASTFYHVFLAFAELLRLEPHLSHSRSPHGADQGLEPHQREQHR